MDWNDKLISIHPITRYLNETCKRFLLEMNCNNILAPEIEDPKTLIKVKEKLQKFDSHTYLQLLHKYSSLQKMCWT